MLFLSSYPPFCDKQDTPCPPLIVPCPSTCISPFHDLKMLQVLLASAQTPDIVLIKSKSYEGCSKVHVAAQKPGPPSAKLLFQAGMLQGTRGWQPQPQLWQLQGSVGVHGGFFAPMPATWAFTVLSKFCLRYLRLGVWV